MTGTDLRRRREALGLSQQGLAERLDVAKMTVWRWEHDRLRVEHPGMLALAIEALEVRQHAK